MEESEELELDESLLRFLELDLFLSRPRDLDKNIIRIRVVTLDPGQLDPDPYFCSTYLDPALKVKKNLQHSCQMDGCLFRNAYIFRRFFSSL